MNNITFKQFIYTYNFRYCNDIKDTNNYDNDTQIIRIYPQSNDNETNAKDDWFEFGIYDFSSKDKTWQQCKKALSKDILNSYVSSIQYNEDYNKVVTIYLTNESEYEVYE